MTSPANAKSSRLNASLLGWLLLMAPRFVRAENSVTYKYETYTEDDNRITVKTQGALIEQDLGTDMHVKVEGVIDAIAGATPTGLPFPAGSTSVDLSSSAWQYMKDRRKAWNTEISRQFPGFNLAVGLANSREHDYVSTGWSVNTVTDFNQKNTELLAGVAGTDDDVQEYFQPDHHYLKKRSNDALLGFTQLLDPRTTVGLNLSWGHETGYLSDPHRLVAYNIVADPGPPPIILPSSIGENRPDHSTKWTVLATLNHAFPDLHAAVEATYRFYHATSGTNANMVQFTWIQRLGDHFVLQPDVRWYEQTAANYYYYDLTQTSIVPTGPAPNPQGPFFSSDYRLSALRSVSYAMKVVWIVNSWLQIDVAARKYDMHGRDSATPAVAYPRATITTLGAKISW